MAFLIPETLRTCRDVPPGVNRLARALQESIDDAATVWYEPLFDPSGDRPDVVLLIPDLGVLVLEVLESKANAVTAAVRDGRLVIERDGASLETEHPLRRAASWTGSVRESRSPRC